MLVPIGLECPKVHCWTGLESAAICLQGLPTGLPSHEPLVMKPITGDLRILHQGEVLLAISPAFNFRFPSLTPPNSLVPFCSGPSWPYITLADASHAFPQPSGQRNEQRAGQDDLGRGLLGSHRRLVPTLPALAVNVLPGCRMARYRAFCLCCWLVFRSQFLLP